MSWKSFVTAGLLCALASPVFAAPNIQVIKGGTHANGHLDASGNWVWLVRIGQTTSPAIVDVDNGGPLSPGSPLAAELGFRELLGELLAANRTGLETPAWGITGTAHDNPGNGIFGWEVLTDTDNDGSTGTCGAPPCKFGEVGADTGDEPIDLWRAFEPQLPGFLPGNHPTEQNFSAARAQVFRTWIAAAGRFRECDSAGSPVRGPMYRAAAAQPDRSVSACSVPRP